jgi:hypothetical protein
MKGYAQTDVLPPWAIKLWEYATKFVDRLPERDPTGKRIRCHEIARAVHAVLGRAFPEVRLEVEDGYYNLYPVRCNHSWLVLYDKLKPLAILDTYSVGRLPPCQLLDADTALTLYSIGPVDLEIDQAVVSWLQGFIHFGRGTANEFQP